MLIADMAQSVERRLGKAEVTGSIPVISLTCEALCVCTVLFLFYGKRPVSHKVKIIPGCFAEIRHGTGQDCPRLVASYRKPDINYQRKKEWFFGENIRKRRENIDFCRMNDTIKGELLWLNLIPKE